MGYKGTDEAQETLCVLNDVCFYSLAESRWLPTEDIPSSPPPPHSLIPRARYAHLSSVSSDMLFIIGGQDLANGWLDDIHVYDLQSRSWVHRRDYPRHCGTYRSVALSSTLCVRNPESEPTPPPAPRFRSDDTPSALPVTLPETFVQLPYSTPPTPTFPSEIFLYSNYNVGIISY
jgi:leucine-zipper-like transcriptional regulator 1